MVAIKRVLDPNIKAQVRPDGSGIELSNRKMAMNPFCEIAVEEAVRLKEQGVASEVLVVSVGDAAVQEQLRSALALGADRAIHLQTPAPLSSSLAVAKLLKIIAERERPQLILLGKQSIDSDNYQTGQMLAGLLDWPQATAASAIALQGEEAIVTCEVDSGLRTLQLRLPAVITSDLRLNTPRYPALPSIMKARQKPLEVLSADVTGVALDGTQRQLSVTPPAARKPGRRVSSVAELAGLIRSLSEEN